MDSRKWPLLTCFLALIAATVSGVQSADEAIQQIQANYRFCENDELLSPGTATDLQVFIPQCQAVNGSESRCILHKGETPVMTIKFKTIDLVSDLERIIAARVPTSLGQKVEMPYGPAISPCVNSSMIATDGTGCVDEGVVANKSYSYVSSFDVLQSFPSVQDVETRIILRKRNDKHRKIRLYRKHPGPTVFCIVIPNIEVAE